MSSTNSLVIHYCRDPVKEKGDDVLRVTWDEDDDTCDMTYTIPAEHQVNDKKTVQSWRLDDAEQVIQFILRSIRVLHYDVDTYSRIQFSWPFGPSVMFDVAQINNDMLLYIEEQLRTFLYASEWPTARTKGERPVPVNEIVDLTKEDDEEDDAPEQTEDDDEEEDEEYEDEEDEEDEEEEEDEEDNCPCACPCASDYVKSEPLNNRMKIVIDASGRTILIDGRAVAHDSGIRVHEKFDPETGETIYRYFSRGADLNQS